MRLTTVAVFGLGYLLGSRAGRTGYEQVCGLAHDAAEKLAAPGLRQRLEACATRLDAYSSGPRQRRTPAE